MTLKLLNDNITTGAVTRQATLRPEELSQGCLMGSRKPYSRGIQGIACPRLPRTRTFAPPIPAAEWPGFGNAGDSHIEQLASFDDQRPDFRDAPDVADEWAKTPGLCRRELRA